jgi:hypothetical protein
VRPILAPPKPLLSIPALQTKPLLKTVVAAAPIVELASTSVEQVSVIRLTSSIQELKTSDLNARLALARSITTVIKKNFNVPKGPEMNVLTMTRSLFGSQIDALKALVTQFMTALKIPFDSK